MGEEMSGLSFAYLGAVVIASVIAAFLSLVTGCVVRRLWSEFRKKVPGAKDLVPVDNVYESIQPFVRWLGGLECAIYSAALLLGSPEMIAVILALKAAPHLKEWSEKQAPGRTMFNIWLIGNLMNVAISTVVAGVAAAVFKSVVKPTP